MIASWLLGLLGALVASVTRVRPADEELDLSLDGVPACEWRTPLFWQRFDLPFSEPLEPTPPTPEEEWVQQWRERYEVEERGATPGALAAIKAVTKRVMVEQQRPPAVDPPASGVVTSAAPRAREARPRRHRASARRARGARRQDEPEPLARRKVAL